MCFERINTGSLTHAQRKCRSRPVDARRRVRVGNFFDVNGAARAGHRDELLARAADEFALGIARGLAECVQSRRACRACWTERPRRPGWADATACTVRASWTRRTRHCQLRGREESDTETPFRRRFIGRSWTRELPQQITEPESLKARYSLQQRTQVVRATVAGRLERHSRLCRPSNPSHHRKKPE